MNRKVVWLVIAIGPVRVAFPDDCGPEGIAGPGEDCNRNGFPDACDIRKPEPTLAGHKVFPIGRRPGDLVAADLNGDGAMDFATSSYVGAVSVGILTAGARAAISTSYPSAFGTQALVGTDVDGDGDLDLVGGNHMDGTAQVLVNEGAGTFVPGQSLPGGRSIWGASAGDVDGDGDADLFLADHDGRAVLARENEGGTFVEEADRLGPGRFAYAAIVMKDLDLDGDLDVATANDSSGNVSLLINGGRWSFREREVTVGTEPASLVVVDIDIDGDPDLITSNPASGTLSLLSNPGAGAFDGAADVPTHPNPRAITAGDFDGDGSPELAVAAPSVRSIAILRFLGEDRFIHRPDVRVEMPGALAACDADGDGDQDFLVVSPGDWNTVSLVANRGDGTFSSAGSLPVPVRSSLAAAGDVDGDGRLDVAMGLGYSVFVLGVSPAGSLLNSETYPTEPRVNDLVMADLDADGYPEIAVCHGGPDIDLSWDFPGLGVSVLSNDGRGRFDRIERVPIGHLEMGLDAGDWEGDGDLDIIVTSIHRGQFTQKYRLDVLVNDGGSLEPGGGMELPGSPGDGVAGSVLSDLDGDRSPDLVAAVEEDLLVFRAASPGIFRDPVRHAVGRNPASLLAGDLDGDGDTDVAAASLGEQEVDGSVSVLENDGYGSLETTAIRGIGRVARSLAAADADGDGEMDLFLINDLGVMVLQANDSGRFEPSVTFGLVDRPLSLLLGDVDGDGAADALVVSDSRNEIAILWNETLPPVSRDCDGNGVPDECQGPRADCDADGMSDLCETDCDRNGLPDECEMEAGTAADCNGNLVPDACESDCNGNMVADACELLAGASEDCNANAVPDECEVAERDCNGNQVPDDCDIRAGVSQDCNANGRPDDCDLDGASEDCNANGIPDECDSLPHLEFELLPGISLPWTPLQLSAGDLDTDGDQDLLVTTSPAITVSSFSNDGRGGFGPRRQIAAGIAPETVIAVDLDADGRQDIVTTSQSGDTVSVMRNLGEERFGEPVQAAMDSPDGVIAEDFDGDGNADLAVWSRGRDWVSLLFGRGDGTFASVVELPSVWRPRGVTALDLDVDGRLELATANEDSISPFLNEGGRTFAALEPLPADSPSGIVGGDMDGDGRADIAVAGEYSANVTLFLGKGNGAFREPASLGAIGQPPGILGGDVDRNGTLDLVTGRLQVLLNNGQARFTPSPPISEGIKDFWRPLLADLDGDQDLDMAVGMFESREIAVLLNRSVSPSSRDCNANGSPDECDVDRGISLDTNANGLPDECEVFLFHRGDPDGDGSLVITDAIFLFDFFFLGGPEPTCNESADANNDARLNITDPIFLLNYLFTGTSAPPAPGPPPEPCGPDTDRLLTPAALSCRSYEGC